MSLKDCKITKSQINEREELSLNILVKKWDYNDIELQLLRQAKIEGNTIDFDIIGFVKSDDETEIKEWRTKLWIIMSEYCKKFHYKEEDMINVLYGKYSIKSRTELSLNQLQYEYECFRTAIIQDQP